MPRTSTSWSPGQSGNPGGRPKVLTEIRDLAREHTEAAISTLSKIMEDEDAPAAARVSAAESILSRGWGKAPQFSYVESRSVQVRDMAPDWLRERLAARPAPLLIEGEAQDEEVAEDWC